jgi:Zn-dependent protease with chaperone function
VQWLFYSHPPIRERIEAARQWSPSGGAPPRTEVA